MMRKSWTIWLLASTSSTYSIIKRDQIIQVADNFISNASFNFWIRKLAHMNVSHQRLDQFLLKRQAAALSFILFIQGMPSNKQFLNESNNEKISRKEKIKILP